jgi:serine/threonine-protein phosphatase 5
MTDLVWSDPIKENGRQPSKRGVSIGFGPDVTHRYLKENSLGNNLYYIFKRTVGKIS